MSDRIVARSAVGDELGRGLVIAGRICLTIGAGLLAVLLILVVREARAQMQGREHVLEGVGHVLAAATIGGLAMLAWLAGILAEILTVAVGALILSLVALGWKRLAPEPVVLWLLAGPIGRLLGVDGQAKRLQRSARRREAAERPP